MIRRTARLVGWLTALATATAVLVWLERFAWLRVDWSDPMGWAAGAELEAVLAAGGRLVALGICAWLILSTLAYVVARLLGADRQRVDWLAIGPIRGAVEGVLAAAMMVNTVTPALADSPDPSPVVPVETPATLTLVDPAYVPVPAGPGGNHAADEATEEPSEPSADEIDHAQPAEVVVAPGDHLWKLAADRVGAALGRAPTEADVAPYWVRVVEANRDRIRSGDPDLIFPGEVIVLPEIDS